jgi:hypothetical protein
LDPVAPAILSAVIGAALAPTAIPVFGLAPPAGRAAQEGIGWSQTIPPMVKCGIVSLNFGLAGYTDEFTPGILNPEPIPERDLPWRCLDAG